MVVTDIRAGGEQASEFMPLTPAGHSIIRVAYAERSLVEVLPPDGEKLWDPVLRRYGPAGEAPAGRPWGLIGSKRLLVLLTLRSFNRPWVSVFKLQDRPIRPRDIDHPPRRPGPPVATHWSALTGAPIAYSGLYGVRAGQLSASRGEG